MVAKWYGMADNAHQARAEAPQQFASGWSLTRRESRELPPRLLLASPYHYFCTLLLWRFAMLRYCAMHVTSKCLLFNGELLLPSTASLPW